MGRKFTYEFVESFINSLGYTLLSDRYKNNGEKLKIRCSKGHDFEMKFSQLYNSGSKCPRCGGTAKLLYVDVKEYVENQGYKLLSDKYIKATSNLDFICPEGHEFKMTINNFKNHGQRCPVCSRRDQKKRTYSYEYVKEFIESKGYSLISKEYHGCKNKLIIKCEKHGEWEATFDNFKNSKSRCPKCKNSKGENEISEILNMLNIDYINKYKFNNCKYKRILEFDFYLPKYNCCVEYDGEFHYRKTNRNNENDFKKQQIRDSIKNNYCKKNEIKLIRIPYWDFNNIQTILEKELNL